MKNTCFFYILTIKNVRSVDQESVLFWGYFFMTKNTNSISQSMKNYFFGKFLSNLVIFNCSKLIQKHVLFCSPLFELFHIVLFIKTPIRSAAGEFFQVSSMLPKGKSCSFIHIKHPYRAPQAIFFWFLAKILQNLPDLRSLNKGGLLEGEVYCQDYP